jgi:hypothetical protein
MGTEQRSGIFRPPSSTGSTHAKDSEDHRREGRLTALKSRPFRLKVPGFKWLVIE